MSKEQYLINLIQRDPHPAYIAMLARLQGKDVKQSYPKFVYFINADGTKGQESY